MDELQDRIKNDFRHHSPPDPESGEPLTRIRSGLQEAALFLTDECPPGRELSLALTKLEEAMFWANASIARAWD